MNIDKLGWIAAAALAGGMVGMGFRAPGDKTGIVDIGKVFQESDYAKKQKEDLRAQLQLRQDVFKFIQDNRNMKADDATKLKNLSIKEPQTAADKSDIERIKTDAQAAEATARQLQTMDKPTAAQLAQLDDFTKRKDATGQLLQTWETEFRTEFQQKQDKVNTDMLAKVREAIQQIGHDQGYSVIFSEDVAPYCPNDVTTEALNKMNKK